MFHNQILTLAVTNKNFFCRVLARTDLVLLVLSCTAVHPLLSSEHLIYVVSFKASCLSYDE